MGSRLPLRDRVKLELERLASAAGRPLPAQRATKLVRLVLKLLDAFAVCDGGAWSPWSFPSCPCCLTCGPVHAVSLEAADVSEKWLRRMVTANCEHALRNAGIDGRIEVLRTVLVVLSPQLGYCQRVRALLPSGVLSRRPRRTSPALVWVSKADGLFPHFPRPPCLGRLPPHSCRSWPHRALRRRCWLAVGRCCAPGRPPLPAVARVMRPVEVPTAWTSTRWTSCGEAAMGTPRRTRTAGPPSSHGAPTTAVALISMCHKVLRGLGCGRRPSQASHPRQTRTDATPCLLGRCCACAAPQLTPSQATVFRNKEYITHMMQTHTGWQASGQVDLATQGTVYQCFEHRLWGHVRRNVRIHATQQ